MSKGYIIQLGPGLWLRPEENNPISMTLLREWATVYPTLEEARAAFATAKRCKGLVLAIFDDVGEDVGQLEGGTQRNE